MPVVNIGDIVGKAYGEFWRFKGRYRVVKGSRGSKKSITTCLWYIYHMMKYPKANLLVVRKIYKDHKDSTFAQLIWAIHKLQVQHLWKWTVSPVEIIYIPTGQKIMFRGLDDPMSITSITVAKGFLCWCWFEEAYQIAREDDFDKVDTSFRGAMPEPYFKQITLTFNPWNERHWLKRRFFDNPDEDTLAMTTTYMCNEFLGEDDRQLMENKRKTRPRQFRVEGLGEWGVSEGVIFENWEEKDYNIDEIKKIPDIRAVFGLDFGYSTDPTAFIGALVSDANNEIYVFDEYTEKGLLNNQIAEIIKYKGYAKERIIADSAELKSIEEIRRFGIARIVPARKGPDSIRNGIQKLQQYKIYVHPSCQQIQVELSNYAWEKKNDDLVNRPIDEFNHLIDALRYAMERKVTKARIDIY